MTDQKGSSPQVSLAASDDVVKTAPASTSKKSATSKASSAKTKKSVTKSPTSKKVASSKTVKKAAEEITSASAALEQNSNTQNSIAVDVASPKPTEKKRTAKKSSSSANKNKKDATLVTDTVDSVASASTKKSAKSTANSAPAENAKDNQEALKASPEERQGSTPKAPTASSKKALEPLNSDKKEDNSLTAEEPHSDIKEAKESADSPRKTTAKTKRSTSKTASKTVELPKKAQKTLPSEMAFSPSTAPFSFEPALESTAPTVSQDASVPTKSVINTTADAKDFFASETQIAPVQKNTAKKNPSRRGSYKEQTLKKTLERTDEESTSISLQDTPALQESLVTMSTDKNSGSIHDIQQTVPDEKDSDLPSSEAEQALAQPDLRQGDKKRRGHSRRNKGKKQTPAVSPTPDTDQPLWIDGATDSFFSPDDDFFNTESDVSGEEHPDKLSTKNDKQEKKEPPAKLVRKKMFVSIVPEEQIEVVLTEEGQVQEYYVDMLHQAKTKGNIYKGVIHNIDPNLQAAFVSYGAVKNGFLQIDEIHPEYYAAPHESTKGRKYPPIQKVLKAGQEVLIQVVKEPAGTKGAFLTTYLSLPGRFLVLTPGREQIGVSRKVDNEAERTRLRDLLGELDPGQGLGVIVRTVSTGASLENLKNDLAFLQRTWSEVRAKGTTLEAPSLIYQELDLTTRAVRDYLTDEVVEIWVDDQEITKNVTELAKNLFPRKKNLVKIHKDPTTLFERFNLQKQLAEIHSREVSLPSGGRLVIDPTEALTAIDINSGRSSGKNNFEDMAYRTNMDAARMIPLQLRLRDIGGQVVVDFIEMRDRSHWREVEKTVRAGMKCDRARYDVGKISSFGMLEIVRQRLGSSAISISTEPCPHCQGTGVRRNMEWQSQQALREITRLMKAAQNQENKSFVYETDPAVALHLLNSKRQRLAEMEQSFGVQLEIRMKHAIIE